MALCQAIAKVAAVISKASAQDNRERHKRPPAMANNIKPATAWGALCKALAVSRRGRSGTGAAHRKWRAGRRLMAPNSATSKAKGICGNHKEKRKRRRSCSRPWPARAQRFGRNTSAGVLARLGFAPARLNKRKPFTPTSEYAVRVFMARNASQGNTRHRLRTRT